MNESTGQKNSEPRITPEPEIVIAAKREFEECLKLLIDRDKKYGDSWKFLSEAGIKEMMHDKIRRTDSPTIPVDEKIEQLRDVANYAFIANALIIMKRTTAVTGVLP